MCVCLQNKKPELGEESILSLMSSVDEWIPEPVRVFDKPFLMPVESTFSIPGRGTVVSGNIERGKINKGDEVEFIGYKSKVKTIVTGLLSFSVRMWVWSLSAMWVWLLVMI